MDEHKHPSTLDPIKNISNKLRSPAPTWCGIISQCLSRLLVYSKKIETDIHPLQCLFITKLWYRAEKGYVPLHKVKVTTLPKEHSYPTNRAWIVCSCIHGAFLSTLYNRYVPRLSKAKTFCNVTFSNCQQAGAHHFIRWVSRKNQLVEACVGSRQPTYFGVRPVDMELWG
jgi:hypothetical protein